MSLVDLDVERAPAEFALALVVELHPGRGVVEAGALPVQAGIGGGGGGADEGGQEIQGAAEAVEDRPRELPGQQRERVLGAERQFRGLREGRDGGDGGEEGEKQRDWRRRSHCHRGHRERERERDSVMRACGRWIDGKRERVFSVVDGDDDDS